MGTVMGRDMGRVMGRDMRSDMDMDMDTVMRSMGSILLQRTLLSGYHHLMVKVKAKVKAINLSMTLLN
jgi:hypothetical protein